MNPYEFEITIKNINFKKIKVKKITKYKNKKRLL